MKLVPLGDRVVLKQLVAEETTKSGIVLPGQNKEKPQQAEVVAVGPGGVVDGKEVKMEVKVGDQVIYSKYAGTEVKLDDEEYIVVKQNDILAVIEQCRIEMTDEHGSLLTVLRMSFQFYRTKVRHEIKRTRSVRFMNGHYSMELFKSKNYNEYENGG